MHERAESPHQPAAINHQAGVKARIGDTLNGRFVLESEIGRGGMGVVFKARDLRKEEARDREPYVAIKVLSSALSRQPDAFIALQRETKKTQRLAHPNIATVYDFDRDGGLVYMTMELLDGESLAGLIKRTAPAGLTLQQAMPIIKGLASGLDYAHQNGIVHADFKPANAFVLRGGAVKVLDFGIARAVIEPGNNSTERTLFDPAKWQALTPAYASCEMFDQLDPDPRDDVYALACVTYELLAGHHPFQRMPANQARAKGLDPENIPALPHDQNRALRRALAFERTARTGGTLEFLGELEGQQKSTSNPGGRTKWAWLLSGSLLIAMLAGLAHWWSAMTQPDTTMPTSVVVEPNTTSAPTDPEHTTTPPGQTTPPAALVSPPSASPPPLPDAATMARIGRILEMADLHLLIGRLVEPAGSNAAEAYQAVLQMHPENERARQGLAQICDIFLDSAQSKLNRKDYAGARSDVNAGLNLIPRHAGLLAFKRRIERENATISR